MSWVCYGNFNDIGSNGEEYGAREDDALSLTLLRLWWYDAH